MKIPIGINTHPGSETINDHIYHKYKGKIKNMDYNLKLFLDNHTWGGSGIEKCLFDFILNKIEPGSTICELGSGKVSTPALSRFYNLYSVENDPNYIDIYENVNYIFSPIVDGWYNPQVLEENLPKNLGMLFVDGPLGEGNRKGIIQNYNIFKECPIFIFHDTHRDTELDLAKDFAILLGKKISIYDTSSTLGDRADFWACIE